MFQRKNQHRIQQIIFILNKKFLLSTCFFTWVIALSGFGIDALIVYNGNLYYSASKKLIVQNLKTQKVLKSVDIDADTGLRNGMNKCAQSIFKIKPMLKNGRRVVIGQNFDIINLASKNNKVYVVIRFRMLSDKEINIKFAIAEYDTLLRFRDVFILPNFMKEFKFNILPPYHEMEFLDSNRVLINTLESNGMDYVIYKLNRKIHSIQREHALVTNLKFYGGVSEHVQDRTYQFPAIYAVPGSNSSLFYTYPIPFFFYANSNNYIDPYRIKSRLDSFELNHSNPSFGDFMPDLSYRLTKHPSYKLEGGIVMASYQSDSMVYAVIATQDEFETDLVIYSVSSKTSKILKMNVSSDWNFVFHGTSLFMIETDASGKLIIKERALSEFSFP